MDFRSIRIDKVEDNKFNCPECSTISRPKYSVVINDDYEKIMCLNCHNKIAYELSSKNKKRKAKAVSLYERMYGEKDNKEIDWQRFYN